jgi:hypothetical protein
LVAGVAFSFKLQRSMTPPLSDYPEDEIIAEAFRIMRGRQKAAPKAKKLTLCPKGCGNEYGARDLRKHIPQCDGKPGATKPSRTDKGSFAAALKREVEALASEQVDSSTQKATPAPAARSVADPSSCPGCGNKYLSKGADGYWKCNVCQRSSIGTQRQ